jgi:hypothetical protein
LLERVLNEAKGDQVRPTMDAWRRRTQEFIERADEESPSWVDREGNRWNAHEVLELLDDAQDRIDSWEAAPGPGS